MKKKTEKQKEKQKNKKNYDLQVQGLLRKRWTKTERKNEFRLVGPGLTM